MDPWHIVITFGVACFTAVAGLNAWLLNSINNRLVRVENKLDSKIDSTSCDRIRSECNRYRDVKEEDAENIAKLVERDFLRHTHEGLPPNSKVILL